MLFPTSEPPPSGPWHIAHFVLKVALLAAPSGPGLACTIEATKSVRPTKSTSKIVEANITWRSVLSCVMAFPLLAISLPAPDTSPSKNAEIANLNRALRSANPLLACRLQRKSHCRTPPQTAARLAHQRRPVERRYPRCTR